MRLHRQWKRAISFLTSVVLTTVSIVPGISPMTAYAAGEDPSKVYVVGSDSATELNESLPSMYDAGTYTAKYIEDGSEEHYAKKKFEWTDKNAGEGKITIEQLKLLDIDYTIITKDSTFEDLKSAFENKFEDKLKEGISVAIVVSKGAFEDYKIKKSNNNPLSRELAIQTVANFLNEEDMIISTTGKSSRELFEYRENNNQCHGNDFLTVGSMGHSSSIGLGVALNSPDKKIFCFDGDGAVLMHMGSLGLIGSEKPQNFYHIMFNNSAHESVGGLPTIMSNIDIEKLVLACGYENTFSCSNIDELKSILPKFIESKGPVFLNIDVSIESRKDLGRPTTTPIENKNEFMKKLNK